MSFSQQHLPLIFLNPLGLRTQPTLSIFLELNIGLGILEQYQKLEQDVPVKIKYVTKIIDTNHNVKPSTKVVIIATAVTYAKASNNCFLIESSFSYIITSWSMWLKLTNLFSPQPSDFGCPHVHCHLTI